MVTETDLALNDGRTLHVYDTGTSSNQPLRTSLASLMFAWSNTTTASLWAVRALHPRWTRPGSGAMSVTAGK